MTDFNRPNVKTQSLLINNVEVTASAAELNILDGVTANATELNILDGVTASTSEINTLDGITADVDELNLLDGVEGPIVNKVYVQGEIVDISSAASSWIVAPVKGDISKIYTVLQGPITVADANVTFELGGTAITDAGITIAYDGSAAGDIGSSTPTALNAVNAGGAIEIITDGGSTDAAKVDVIIEITPTEES